MEVKYFKLIKTIVEEGNIVNSSEKLFLTQSALSHQLSGLEEQLGFKVFHRSRNNWKLTEEGTAFYDLSKEVLLSIDKGLNNIQAIKEGSSGSIKLGTECYSFYLGIPQFMQKMKLLYPEIQLDLIDAVFQPIKKLLDRELDAALVTELPLSDQLQSVELFEDEVFCLMHKDHPLAQKEYLEARDFEELHLLFYSFPLESVSVYQHFLKPHQVEPQQISAIPLTEVSLEMVATNMGVLCVSRWVIKTAKVSEDIVLKKLGPKGLKRKHYLISHTADQHKKYMQDFCTLFQEEFGKR